MTALVLVTQETGGNYFFAFSLMVPVVVNLKINHLFFFKFIFMFSRLDFQDSSGKMSSHSINALPSYLMERLTLLRYFAQYMDENLTEGGDSQSGSTAAAPAVGTPRCRPSFVHMKRWVRTPKAIIMQLDNNTLQVTTTPPFLDCCEIPLMDCNSFFLSSPFLSHFLSVPVDQLFQGPHENCALRFD